MSPSGLVHNCFCLVATDPEHACCVDVVLCLSTHLPDVSGPGIGMGTQSLVGLYLAELQSV